jgi:hypothetical protein
MWLLHYIIPGVVYLFKKNKTMFWGLIAGNFLDLDKIYFRLIGKVGWTESIHSKGFGVYSSIGTYPLHTFPILVFLVLAMGTLFFLKKRNKKLYFLFWMAFGGVLHFALDYIQKVTGIIL